MPQLQYNYDYDEYERVKSNRASKSRSTTTGGRSTSRNSKNTTVKKNEVISHSVREANRASIRSAINADDELYVRRAPSTKSKTTTSGSASNDTPKNVTKKTTQKAKTTVNHSKKNTATNPKKMEKPKEMSLKNAEVAVDSKTKARLEQEKKHRVFKNISYALCAFSILFLICYRSSSINESFKSVNKMKSELESIQTMNAQMESEIQTQTDLSNIETYAKYQLGMQKPKESQIRKVVIEKEDKIATPVVIAEEEETSFWKSLWSDLVHLID